MWWIVKVTSAIPVLNEVIKSYFMFKPLHLTWKVEHLFISSFKVNVALLLSIIVLLVLPGAKSSICWQQNSAPRTISNIMVESECESPQQLLPGTLI